MSTPDREAAVPGRAMAFDYEAALAACAGGDRDALRALYDREARRLMGVTLRIVRQRQVAEEVLQEAFLQIWRAAGTFDPGGGFGHRGSLPYGSIRFSMHRRRRSPNAVDTGVSASILERMVIARHLRMPLFPTAA